MTKCQTSREQGLLALLFLWTNDCCASLRTSEQKLVEIKNSTRCQRIHCTENDGRDKRGQDHLSSKLGCNGCPGLRARNHLPTFDLRLNAQRQDREQDQPPEDEVDCEAKCNAHASSNSTSVPQKSFGWRNKTGLPWAPILGSPSPSTRAPSPVKRSRALIMSSTS